MHHDCSGRLPPVRRWISHPRQQALMAVLRIIHAMWLTAGTAAAGAPRSEELHAGAAGLREERRAELRVEHCAELVAEH